MKPEQAKNTFKAGLFVSVLFLVVGSFIFVLGKNSNIFGSKNSYFTLVENAQNLKTGAIVQLRGIKVGLVKTIQILDVDQIKIEMAIDAEAAKWVKEDSFVSISTQGMLGDKFVEIQGGSKDSPTLAEGGNLKLDKGFEMKDFISKGDNVLGSTNSILSRLDQLLSEGSLGKTFISMASAADKINRLLQNIPEKNMTSIVANLDKSLKNFSSISDNLVVASNQLNNGPGTMYSLLYDGSVYEDLQTLLGGAKRNKMLRYFIRESIIRSEKVDQEKK